jgi:inorganic pyrophosphatase
MDINKISAGKNVPEEINVVIEIPQGSSVKYELDKGSGAIMVDRFLHTAIAYPFNYGFIPQTHAEDGDPVDVLLLSSLPVVPGSVIAARPIGLLEMQDEAGPDNKILAVPIVKVDADFADVHDVSDLKEPTKNKIKHFFESYKQLEPGKWVKTKKFLGKEKAFEEIRRSQ